MKGDVLDYGKVRRGEELPHSKLTARDVQEVRRLHRRKEELKRRLDEKYSHEALAAAKGVAVSTMGKVLSYETWRHVPDLPLRRRAA